MRLDEFARQARAGGASWQTIGAALGITRQAAWERFRDLPGCAVKGTTTLKLPRLPAQTHAAKQRIDDKIEEHVQQMRAGGASWQTIGAALGITRQGAWERFRDLPGCAVKGTTTSRLTEPYARRYASKQKQGEEIGKHVYGMWAHGASWQTIGDALGITRQSAWERFRSACVYRKDDGIPDRVLEARHKPPHIFSDWVIDAAETDKGIEQWLNTPDIDLGRMTGHDFEALPILLLGRPVLRNFLMSAAHNASMPATPTRSVTCPTCGRLFLDNNFLKAHKKRDHRRLIDEV